MAWGVLLLAGVFEVVGVGMMNQYQCTRDQRWLLGLLPGFGLSFLFLGWAMNVLPMGTAYAVWTGIGASGGAVVGMVFYGESRDARRILFIAMIIGAVIGLKVIT